MRSMNQLEITSLNSQALNRLGIAQKAGKLITGEQVLKSIRNQEAQLVIIAQDASNRTKKQLTNKCKYYNIQYHIGLTIDNLSKAIGKNNRVALAISDRHFANMLLKNNEEGII